MRRKEGRKQASKKGRKEERKKGRKERVKSKDLMHVVIL
jgi:hypothetical protein